MIPGAVPRWGGQPPGLVPCGLARGVHYSISVDVQPETDAALTVADVPTAVGSDRGRPPGLLGWLLWRLFRHVRVDERWSTAVRDSAASGAVVYVMRTISLLDFLCLDFLSARFRLPRVRFVNDLGVGALEPKGQSGRRIRVRRSAPREFQETLGALVRGGQSALLFLRKPRFLSRATTTRLDVDLIAPLIEAQRKLDTPIFIVPQTFVWGQRPPSQRISVVDLFFGSGEDPGRLRTAFQFLFNRRNARLRTGEPFDLQRFMASRSELTDAQMADKVRYALLQRIERERRLVVGPTQKDPRRIMDELLRSPRLQPALEAHQRRAGKPMVAIKHEARNELRHLCANQQSWMLRRLSRFLNWIFHRIYDGTVVDGEGLERVRAAGRQGTLVYLPSHKSHVDYLVLSHVLAENDLQPPLIAAGENLSFWPLGPILRRGGAFFIKRSFKGNKLYPALVDAYMRKLMVEGFPIEVFIEGGRSRTGKLLAPKYGLLSMIADAALKLRLRKVFFVPVSIGYERVIEEGAYLHELSGGEKKKENVGGLIKSGNVLRSRYGRLYVQFGDVLDFDELVRQQLARQGADPADREALKASSRRLLVQRLAHNVNYEIDRATIVTPAALVASALMARRRRGTSSSELFRVASELVVVLERKGARVAQSLRDDEGKLRQSTLDEALGLLVSSRLVRRAAAAIEGADAVYQVPSERRLALEYYKNNIIHFFVPSALIAAGFRSEYELTFSELEVRVRELSRLFKYEFMFRADTSFDAIFADEVEAMVEAGELEREGELIRIRRGRSEHVRRYARMIDSYFDAYRLALDSVRRLADDGAQGRKDWVRRSLALGQRAYLAGEIDRREALSKPKLEMALKLFKDRKIVRFGADNLVFWDDEGGVAQAEHDAIRELLEAHAE